MMSNQYNQKGFIKAGSIFFLTAVALLYLCFIVTSHFYNQYIKGFQSKDASLIEVIDLKGIDHLILNCNNECNYYGTLKIIFADVTQATLNIVASNSTDTPFKISRQEQNLTIDFLFEMGNYKYNRGQVELTLPLTVSQLSINDIKTEWLNQGANEVQALTVYVQNAEVLMDLNVKNLTITQLISEGAHSKEPVTLDISACDCDKETRIEHLTANIHRGEINFHRNAVIQQADLFVSPKVKLMFGGYTQWQATTVTLMP